MDQASQNNDTQLLDIRSLGFYLGTWKQTYVRRKGHIPSAKVFPTELFTNARAPVRFTDQEDIINIAKTMDIDLNDKLITYCNSGQLASAGWFVISELLGNEDAKLYDGSMHQWALERRPVERLTME